jgi:hypothetical protein
MPWNLLLLPLLGGFLFLHITHFFRFAAQRLDGYRLLLYSALSGTGLVILARLLVILFAPTRVGLEAARWWTTFAPFPYSETSAWALALGPIFAVVVNLFLGAERAKDIEIRRHGNSLTKLLHHAVREERLVSLTLATLKWYVGFVAESPNLAPQEEYFRLLPIISGYRDRETLRTKRTVFYEDVLGDEAVNSDDFVITLPLKDIRIASLFDENVYDEHFAEK